MAFKLIIFDLDGTLVNAYKAVTASLNHTFKTLELPLVSNAKVKASVGWGEKVLIRKLVPAAHVGKALSLYRRHHRKHLKGGVKFLPGAKSMLIYLRRKRYKLAIASNRPTLFTNIILKALNVDSYFDCVLCADKAKKPKPHGVIVKTLLKKLRCEPQEALYIGDMTIDVEEGNNAGVRTVAVLTGGSRRSDIKRLSPFYIAKTMPQLRRFLMSKELLP